MANSDKQNDSSLQKKKERDSERRVVNSIVYWIVGILAILILTLGILGYNYVQESLQPYNSKDNQEVEIKIPVGSSNKEIASKLQDKKIIHSAMVFNYYVKSHNYTDFQAGYYSFKPSMTLTQIVARLQKGGSSERVGQPTQNVIVREGVTVDQIGTEVAKKTPYSKKQFLALMKNRDFLEHLQKKYPQLLDSSMASKDVRYHLEGYLFPATYPYYNGMSLKQIVSEMVSKANQELSPYYGQIKNEDLTVQHMLTLASLIEREGVTDQDRRKISGVFFNRIAADMPLQSDISVMYALNTHKHSLTNKDTSVKSPYNLYKNKGYGPGPFNSPSLSSIQAVLNPSDQDKGYLYFVANLKTGKVYYSTSYSQHLTTNSKIGQ
ncbi:endolytic transglycosylase MltG [Bombilactobacillus thymidiniphilus]|uniref:Endolytic murein transglycosylase n=1 Tax=Bombilactobacillus thymidiniphilus TaxID=2923363 RepID=A0ABY4PCF7_9LACO|nr:endolytic transglycosylase MltG [Bombilactobacillus thymidiniphilus]UQS83381.1 endolytic transglycosylase MltG [Bombilactobacillus thymidiniphilus]